MDTFKKILKGIFGAAVASASLAGEVGTEQVTNFTSGTPAVAAEVNGNFSALIAAINDNAQRLAALESSGGQTLLDKLNGASFKLVGINSKLESGSYNGEDHIAVQLDGFSETITLQEGGTLLMGAGNYKQREISFLPSPFCCGDDADEDYPAATSTWTLSGNTLTTSLNESEDGLNELTYVVSADANLLISTTPGRFHTESGMDGGVPYLDDDFVSEIIIGVRTN